MPQLGALDLRGLERDPVVVKEIGREPWTVEGAEALSFVYEIDGSSALDLIPRALHPAIPPYASLLLRRHPTSPAGAFALAEARIMTRAGIHFGGYVLGAFADTGDAVRLLRERYGCPARLAEIRVLRRHYGIEGTVSVDGRPVFVGRLEEPEGISGNDVLCTPSFYLARVDGRLRLVQFEPEYSFTHAERGRGRVLLFDAAAFGEPRLQLTNPLPATFTRADLRIREVRYLMDPSRPAIEGTEAL
jgi:hypothetical protein